jgi:hypothetical protein
LEKPPTNLSAAIGWYEVARHGRVYWAVLVSSDSRERDQVLTVTLKTEQGDRYMLPLSKQAITQLSEVFTGWRRTREFLDQQEVPESSTL